MSIFFAGHDPLPAMNLVITCTYQFMRTTTNRSLLSVFLFPSLHTHVVREAGRGYVQNCGLVVVLVTTISVLCFDGGR